MTSNITEAPQGPADAISSIKWSRDGETLAIAAWDSCIYFVQRKGDDLSISQLECDAPVLDVCWSANGDAVYAVGLDQEVVMHKLPKLENEHEQNSPPSSAHLFSRHGQASNKVAFSPVHDLILSTSWDATLHVHDNQSGSYVKVKLPTKPFALSLTKERAVVAMAERKIHVYDLAALKMLVAQNGVKAVDENGEFVEAQAIEAQPWQTRESSLKFMTRDTACMPDGTGFAASSIEGRVGVEWFDEQANKQTYAFKCHREKTTVTDGESGDATPMDIIYPVNAIAFHPTHGTFATGGGDGVVALWDAKTKRRIRQYPKLPASVAAMDFSPDGKKLAIAISPGFEDGKEEQEPDPTLIKVYIRDLADNEAKGKAEKVKKESA